VARHRGLVHARLPDCQERVTQLVVCGVATILSERAS
jgi:hypothetical protein